ncbi:hypothetical protein [Caudoviricetes sp.]|nr:hypothetical protein [Caudoviricetes sp.]
MQTLVVTTDFSFRSIQERVDLTVSVLSEEEAVILVESFAGKVIYAPSARDIFKNGLLYDQEVLSSYKDGDDNISYRYIR